MRPSHIPPGTVRHLLLDPSFLFQIMQRVRIKIRTATCGILLETLLCRWFVFRIGMFRLLFKDDDGKEKHGKQKMHRIHLSFFLSFFLSFSVPNFFLWVLEPININWSFQKKRRKRKGRMSTTGQQRRQQRRCAGDRFGEGRTTSFGCLRTIFHVRERTEGRGRPWGSSWV